MEPKVVELSGRVVATTINQGSKSERDAVMLEAADGTHYELRYNDGPSFGDERLDALVGSSITTHGVTYGNTLIMREWHSRD